MNELLKKPYKITLWQDRNVYIVNLEKKYELDPGDIVENQCLEEVCIATIGSSSSDSPIRAINPILTEDLNGSRTFSFQMYSKYWDDKEETFKDNPFLSLLVNERKIKLFYNPDENNDGWYDFVIKSIQEDSESKTFSYTCKDLFVNELGKTGYDIELNTELSNNMGTIKQLASKILEGSDWEEVDSEVLVQYNKEGLYLYQTSQPILAETFDGYEIYIPTGEWIYIFYSCKANQESTIQFLYKENDATTYEEAQKIYEIDQNGFIINATNYKTSSSYINYNNVTNISNYFGKKIIQRQLSEYFPGLEENCYIYEKNNAWYFCYTDFEYTSAAEIQNLISNGTDFINTNGWGSDSHITYGPTSVDEDFKKTLIVQGSFWNTGIYDNRKLFSPNGLVKNNKYILAIKWERITNFSIFIRGKKVETNYITLSNNAELITNSNLKPLNILTDYDFYVLTINVDSIDYNSLLEYQDLQLYFEDNYSSPLIPTKIYDVRFFKYQTDNDGRIVVPDLSNDLNAVIKKRYNFFSEEVANNFVTKEELKFSEIRYDTDGYTPKLDPQCQKVTSITGSKSNRFNLIQSLCEAFECWAKFTIDHDEKGKILYEYRQVGSKDDVIEDGTYYYKIEDALDDTDDRNFIIVDKSRLNPEDWQFYYKKYYHKYVTFKEYIGEENFAGFRYGINLKSIQRNIVSDQIATKVIVEDNVNEISDMGVCTIQSASLNPTGERALYNFQYYINQNLLSQESINKDLYGTDNNDIGLYVNLKKWNNIKDPLIEEQAHVLQAITEYQSQYITETSALQAAEQNKQEYINIIVGAGYPEDVSPNDDVPEEIRKYARERDSAQQTISDISQRITQIQDNLRVNEEKNDYIVVRLNDIKKKKDNLVKDFERKYFNYIQEGTWTSGDYYDPELYYNAANQVLYTSSFPQVSYTINVLELSQVDGYESYQFRIADKTYIEDTDFFGYAQNGRPYQEEIVVSQIKSNLDDPSQNTITVQNYKTQFQDLFQRIAATSQTLQYKEGVYNRAANIVNNNGTIDSVLMQNTLKDNELIIQNAKDQSVVWDESGITITNTKNASEIVRLASGGIAISSNGGKEWTTGITGEGINAKVITTGILNTNLVRIFNENMQTFEWNPQGIHAFAVKDNKTDFGTFVRFDQYGIYGYNKGVENWSPNNIDNVIDNSIFSLTWKGLNINVVGQGFTLVSDPSESPIGSGWWEYDNNLSEYKRSTDLQPITGKNYYIYNGDPVINVNNHFQVFPDGSLSTDSVLSADTILASRVIVNGQSITDPRQFTINDEDKIQSSFLNLKGLTVKDTYNNTTFTIGAEDGLVSIFNKMVLNNVANTSELPNAEFSMTGAVSANKAFQIRAFGAMRLLSSDGNIFLGAGSGTEGASGITNLQLLGAGDITSVHGEASFTSASGTCIVKATEFWDQNGVRNLTEIIDALIEATGITP